MLLRLGSAKAGLSDQASSSSSGSKKNEASSTAVITPDASAMNNKGR